MNRWLIGLVVVGIAVGVWRWQAARSAPDTLTYWQPLTVDLGRLKEAIPCDGTLEPQSRAEIKSRVAGEIVSLNVQEGEVVQAGTVIAQLDTEQLVQQVRQAEANLQASRAQLSLAERGYSPSERVNREQQAIDAQLNLDQAQRELDRVTGLHAQGFASEAEVDNARTRRDLAQGDLEVAQQLLKTLQAGGEKEDREVARASVIRNTAILETAREELANATIKAPVSGTILSLPVEVGNTVSSGITANSGGTVIATIGNMETLRLEGTVDESDIGRVRPGLVCEITTDAYPNLLFKGRVVSIAPQATVAQNVSTFRVKIEVDIDNPTVQRSGGRSAFRGTFAGARGGGGGRPGGEARAMARAASGGGPGRPGSSGKTSGPAGGAANPNIPSDAPVQDVPAPTLRAGMTATAEIILTAYDEAPVVPLKFVLFDEDQKAYVLKWPEGAPLPTPPGKESEDENPTAQKYEPEKIFVEIGYTDGVSYALASGVKPGDVLVTEAEIEMETKWGAFGMRQVPKKS
ncbi:MAG: Multidrug resistance protein MdtA [bacterium]|nr:Multidrug resistance protein MdtA [bacterium]